MCWRFILLVFVICTSSATNALAQKQANVWYFGQRAGLDFNSGSPVPLLDGEMATREGNATIADENGDLLFYTDGIRVWNANHQQMPNGFGMTGDPSSSQSGVIVPKPGDPDTYFIFTVAARIGRLDYSIINMREDGGLGDIVTKNVPLLSSSTEKISAVFHQNGRDIWVIGHEWNNDKFYAWLITETGVSVSPVITSAGSPHVGGGGEAIGYLKFSPNNEKLAVAGYDRLDFVEVFDFDNATGTLTFESQYTGFGASGPYGVEFSPNSQYLYIAERAGRTSLYQVEVGTASGPIAAAALWSFRGREFGALQLATDGKIYLARDFGSYLSTIHQPDEAGEDIQFVLDGVWLGDRSSTLGLPTFIQSFFRRPNFAVDDHCYSEIAQFNLDPDDEADFDSLLWNFGDPASGGLNSSTEANPRHLFSDSGAYEVTLTGYLNGANLIRTEEVEVHPLPDFDLGNGRLLLNGENTELSVPENGNSYTWNDGNNETMRTLSTPGWHWVDGTNAFACTIRDSIAVFNLSYADTCFNAPTAFTLDAGNIDIDSVHWQFGDPNSGVENSSELTSPSHTFTAAGDYYINLVAYYQGEEIDRSFSINIQELPDADLPESLVLLNDATQTFNTGSLTTSWENGSTDNARTINSPGWHWADLLTEAGCTDRDSVAVFSISYADTCFTSLTRLSLEAGNIAVDSVHWNLGDAPGGAGNVQSGAVIDHEFSAPGNYTINVNIYYRGRSLNTDFNLSIASLPQFDLALERTLFYGETERLSVTGTGTSYLWQDGSTHDELLIQGPGLYWVEVTNQASCNYRDSVQINYDQIIDVRLPDDMLFCPNDELPLDMTLPGATYQWQDGSTNSTYTVDSPGIYWVEVTNAFQNRVLRDSITVEYYSFGELEILSQHVICATQSLELVATGAKEGESYRWYDESRTLLAENAGTFTTPELSADTQYFVSITNGPCETEPIGINIINDMVTARIAPLDSIVDMGEPVYLNGSGGEYYQWTPATWLDRTDQPSVVAYPDNDIEYTLTVTGAWGCTNSTSVRVYVERAIYAPDAFSPNGDGHNDTWEIKNLDRFPNNRVEIYNRAGKLVATFKDYQNQWDGTINGSYLLGYTFHYIIYYDNPVRTEHGAVRILR